MNVTATPLPFALQLIRRMICNAALMISDYCRSPERVGAEQRFNTIVNEHARLISKVCYCYAVSRQDFDDMRQDCLINIWRGLESFDGRSRLSSWLYRVCINTCITSWRGKSRRPQCFSFDELGEMPTDSSDDDSRNDNVELLHSLISSLPYVDRAIIMMWLDECPYDEIAEVTGLSKSNVAVKIHRLKNRMAESIRNNNL
ncbi:MAG: sigma-70 family RNA polymerase sigma factor [Muribaculaceae bacterium]|nr:sigma-70 family RNA polymerase sigma factor [Muribaculaceae bacterium]